MFSRDKWLEILSTMVNNPLRTLLTGFSVGVGIFILVILLAMTQGLRTGAEASIMDDAVNSIWVRSGRTSKAYAGYQANRQIRFADADRSQMESEYEEVPKSTARISMWGETIRWKGEQSSYGIRAVHPSHAETERTTVTDGRYISQADINEKRKVAVVGATIVEELFKDHEPLGEFIEIRGILFTVVGTFNDPNSRWENRQIYLPLTTGQQLFRGGRDEIDMFILGTGDAAVDESTVVSEGVDQIMRGKHKVDPEDARGVRVRNNNEEFETFTQVFTGIRVFGFAMGIFTLLAGIIGVANIMSIAVKERTREIGVRKALGATPWSVLSLILQESIFLTLVAGCIGFMFGVGLMELVAQNVDHDFFKKPQIDFAACLIALIVLVIAGAISGLIPAMRAASIRPIEALRDQ